MQPEVEGGGATCRVGAKSTVKSTLAEGAPKLLGPYSRKILLFFN